MDSFYLRKLSDIITEIQYATLATVSPDEEPYNAPVFTAFDDRLNFYWSSSPESQHSKNIDHNGKVFIVIYKSTVKQGTGWGAYIKAVASTANPEETQKGLSLLGDRRGKRFTNSESFASKGSQKIYKAQPELVWTNDAEKDSHGEYVKDYRAEVSLEKLREEVRNIRS